MNIPKSVKQAFLSRDRNYFIEEYRNDPDRIIVKFDSIMACFRSFNEIIDSPWNKTIAVVFFSDSYDLVNGSFVKPTGFSIELSRHCLLSVLGRALRRQDWYNKPLFDSICLSLESFSA